MKPPLTVLHRKQRLEWCKLRENWTVEQWRSVIFSDESAFSLLPTTTRTFVRRRPHEGTSASCLSPSLKWRTPKCTQYHGYLAHRQLVQDNAPCHKTNLIRNWMLENAVNAIPWPSCSPDLNPIEQVWAWMKRQIQGRHFASKDDLWHALHSLWLQMSPDFIQRFVDSMPRRLKAVIIAKGGVTRY